MRRSQFGEDGIIQEILKEVTHGNKKLCDIGARLAGSNAAHLLEDHGWTGVLIERQQTFVQELEQTFGERAKVICAAVGIENVNDLVPKDIWLLSLDIDSCDWWVWANMMARPAVVVVETNPAQGMYVPPYPCVYPAYGMSVEAAKTLGRLKGYNFLGVNQVNAFFVRNDLSCNYRLPDPPRHHGDNCDTSRSVFCAS